MREIDMMLKQISRRKNNERAFHANIHGHQLKFEVPAVESKVEDQHQSTIDKMRMESQRRVRDRVRTNH